MSAASGLIQEIVRVFKTLPLWGKLAVMSSLATLTVAIAPTVPNPARLIYRFDSITVKNGNLVYTGGYFFTDKFPDKYINTSMDPEEGDMVIILRERDAERNDVYFYRQERGKRYEDWHQAVWDYKKKQQRTSMTMAFMLSMGLAIGSYPGLIRRLLELIPRRL